MTTNGEQYLPSENEIRADFVLLRTRNFDSYLAGRSLAWEQAHYGDQFDRVLARVRRDAAREALDGLAREAAGVAEASDENINPWVSRVVQGWAEEYRDTHYPRETP